MLNDATVFWEQFRADRQSLVQAIAARYPLVPQPYLERFVTALGSIEGNPQVLVYVESDLGAIGRALVLIDILAAGGVRIAGARCLDVGCSNGALLRAAKARGATTCLGLDTSEERLVSARMVCADFDIEFLLADAREKLPDGFDLILCTDVLEHVPGWRRVVERISNALAPGGAAFISLHNSRHPTTIMSEPHYGIPGLSLLAFSEAAPLWGRVRQALGSALDYDVYEWPSYAELETKARSVGLTPTPWTDSEWMSKTFWLGYRNRRDAFLRNVATALRQFSLPDADAASLLGAARSYGEFFVQDHQRFEQTVLDRLELYMTYYAQPINVLLRRA